MDYSNLTLKKLQQLSRREGLPMKGSKQELIGGLERLQGPAIELAAADLSKSIIPLAPAAAPTSTIENTIAPPHIVEDVTSEPAPPLETAPTSTVAPVLRTSSRVVRPRVCTMCVGCHHHPTHVAGKVTLKAASAAAAVVDGARIVDLTEKFANVNIVPQQQQDENASNVDAAAAAPAKSSPKISKRGTATMTRAPLKSKSNEAKSVIGKSATTKKKVGSLKEIDAASGNGKENKCAGTEKDNLTTERPRRSVKQFIA